MAQTVAQGSLTGLDEGSQIRGGGRKVNGRLRILPTGNMRLVTCEARGAR